MFTVVINRHYDGNAVASGAGFPQAYDNFFKTRPNLEKSEQAARLFMNFNSDSHGAEDVPLAAYGVNSSMLDGFIDNTHIFKVMRETIR